jgi:hypothetical protein
MPRIEADGRCARTVTAQIQVAANRRTLSAQPHKPAQVFLLIVAQRCNKTLAIRGKMSYKYRHLTAQKCNERQQ